MISEEDNQGVEGQNDDDDANEATGACHIQQFDGTWTCFNGLTRKGCHDAAMGLQYNWVKGGRCP